MRRAIPCHGKCRLLRLSAGCRTPIASAVFLAGAAPTVLNASGGFEASQQQLHTQKQSRPAPAVMSRRLPRREGHMHRKTLLLLAALLASAAAPASAQVKIGVLSDMNSLYADITGKG